MPEPDSQTTVTAEVASEAQLYDTRAGIIIGAHGVQGTLKVKPVTATSSLLFSPTQQNKKELTVWMGADRSNGELVQVLSSKRQEPKDVYLVHLRGIGDRTTAEALVGLSIYGQSHQRAKLSEDEYFVEDLIGLAVVDLAGEQMGHLVVVHTGVANDVYETDGGVLIPAVKAFVDRIDLASRTLVVVDKAALAMD